MRRYAVIFTLVFISELQAQTFTLDDFETGDFTVNGSTSFEQFLPEGNVLGGVRRVNLSNTTIDRASVSDGTVQLVRNENSILTLSYGSYGDADPSEHLHFDAGELGEDTFDIAVPLVRREPMTIFASYYSFTIQDGVPSHQYSTAEFNFRSDEPLTKSIPLGEFIGDANFRDIAGFQLQLGSIDFIRTTLEVSGATLTAVPEPAAVAMLTVAALGVFALVRRWKSDLL